LQIRFRLSRPPWWLWLVLLVAAIEVTYIFIISAGTWTDWPTWNANYNQVAEGFRAGHLYIPAVPPPALVASPDPFAWSNSNLWYLDASLYKGHYYLYWGPVPAVLLLVVKVVARIRAEVGDQYPLFAFYTVFLIAGAVLIARMTARLFPELPRWSVLVATLAFAYTSPTTYMFATPGIYEAAIGAAQACLLLGLVIAFEAVWRAGEVVPGRLRLLAAGACWGAAVGCRISAILPATAFVVLTTFFTARTAAGWRDWRGLFARTAWQGAPIAVGVFLLGLFNRLRFDSWFEIGTRYQLNTFPFTISRKFLWLDVYSYLLRPVGKSCRFPFVSALYDIGARGFPHGTKFPPNYSTHEPQAGIWVTSPWTWLVLAALAFAIAKAVRWNRAGRPPLLEDARVRAHVWCVACFAALSFLMPVVFVAVIDTTMRYVADYATGFALLSTWGAWMALTRLRAGWPRWTGLGVLLVLALVTAAIGLLLGFQGYDEMFRNHNPTLYFSLQRKLDLCR
jgi:hypothetical protein